MMSVKDGGGGNKHARAEETMTEGVPVVDLGAFVEGANAAAAKAACDAVAKALHESGCLVVRDPRVPHAANEAFLDMMERYFAQADGVADSRPELSFQVGVTPAKTEVPRKHCALMGELRARGQGPVSECPPIPDAKWRFFWRVGPRPAETAFTELNAAAVVPVGFEGEWATTMDTWGEGLVATAKTVAEMAALGFGCERGAFSRLLDEGPHLLAPTGSDLGPLARAETEAGAGPAETRADDVQVGTVLAGFHYDLNFLTVHGASRFPGLTVWRRDGVAVQPRIPPGCLLVQAGKQLEHCTGGHVLAGFHEVAATEATRSATRAAAEAGKPTWRVSSTCFAHVASDKVLEPLKGSTFDTVANRAAFEPTRAGDQVKAELDAIMLGFNGAADTPSSEATSDAKDPPVETRPSPVL